MVGTLELSQLNVPPFVKVADHPQPEATIRLRLNPRRPGRQTGPPPRVRRTAAHPCCVRGFTGCSGSQALIPQFRQWTNWWPCSCSVVGQHSANYRIPQTQSASRQTTWKFKMRLCSRPSPTKPYWQQWREPVPSYMCPSRARPRREWRLYTERP